MNSTFLRFGACLAVCLALGIAAWTLPGTVRVTQADSNGPCSATSPELPCTVGGTLEVLSLTGSLFTSGGGNGCTSGGGSGATATIINDPLNPGFTLTGNTPCTFAASGTPVTFNQASTIGLATVSGLSTIEDISASITCGTTGNATFSVTFSTPTGGGVTLTCPLTDTVGTVGPPATGHATFTPVRAFTEIITLAGSGSATSDTVTLSSLTLQVSLSTPVPVDIKPGGCPNPLNVGDQGVLPVAILGTSSFDVTKIDPTSVRLEGVAPLRSALEDVATPFTPFIGKKDCLNDCTAAGPDGFLDLTLKFDNQAVVAALGDVTDGQCRVLRLTGHLKSTFGGASISGEDVVIIRAK